MPDQYYSWAWTPAYVRKAEEQEQISPSGLILPGQPTFSTEEPEAALVHFAGLSESGQKEWLWIFETVNEAVALRLLPSYLDSDSDRNASLIEATIPQDLPNQPKMVYPQIIPVQWFHDWDLGSLGIQEVWLGFNFKSYRQHRNFHASTQVFALEEFLQYLKRMAS